MPRKVSEGKPIAQLGSDHPGATDGPGLYEVLTDDENDHTQASFGKKVEWVKNNPEPTDEHGRLLQPANPENNLGHFVYAKTAKSNGDEE